MTNGFVKQIVLFLKPHQQLLLELLNPEHKDYIINYLYSQDIAGMYIFSNHFSIDMVLEKSNNPVAVGSQIEELIKEMQKTINNDMDKLLMKLPLQNPKNS